MKKISFEVPEMDDERGVSPVIGVILMVAITVILAAVIASFVLGFGNSVSSNANAGVDVSVDPGNNGTVTATWISQGSAENVTVTVNQVSGTKSANFTLGEVSQSNIINEGTTGTNSLGIVDTSSNTKVQIIVTAIKGETKTVIQNKQTTI